MNDHSNITRQFNFTRKAILELPIQTKRRLYHDTNPKSNGLKLEVMPSGKKVYLLKQKMDGKTLSINIGSINKFTLEMARNKAREYQEMLSKGVHPKTFKKALALKNITLQQVYEKYKLSKKLRKKTIDGYDCSMRNALSPLAQLKMTEIDFDITLKTFQNYSKKSEASRAMRLLRALFYFAMDELKDENKNPIILENPVKKLFKNRHIRPLPRKRTHLNDEQLKQFVTFFMNMSDPKNSNPEFYKTGSDLILVLLIHGLRITETSELRKEQIDIENSRFCLLNTKNHNQHYFPLTSFSKAIFERRLKLRPDSEYVFPSVTDSKKRISDVKKPLNAFYEASGIKVNPHDLRRTFLTIGERLRIGTYTLKQLANHSTESTDVTRGYTYQTEEELRPASEEIAHYIFNQSYATKSTKISDLLASCSKEEKAIILNILSQESDK